MISRLHRFHGHGSLKYVYQRGQTVRAAKTSLKYMLNERRSTYRLAVVVSKKVSKSAVKRNRIRRRIYEVVRAREAEITKPYDLVITVYDEQLATQPAAKLHQQIDDQLHQAKVLSATSDPSRGKI